MIINYRLKHDLLVVSCDLISNCNLFDLFELYRIHDASVTALLVKGGSDGDIAVPGPKTKYEPGILTFAIVKPLAHK